MKNNIIDCVEADDVITVNLQNVANIRLTTATDRNSGEKFKRIIFNLNYMVRIYKDKYQADFVFWDFKEAGDEFAEGVFNQIADIVEVLNWLQHEDTLINIDEVSSIRYDEAHLRIILNQCAGKSFNFEKITGEFVYLHFQNKMKYKYFIENMILPEVTSL